MIVVLADDLSGAAELAGTALQHGLTAEVQTLFHPATRAEVICLDTNTRLLPAAEASRRVSGIAQAIVATRPDWIFKKCDSVLRGPVLAEARAVAQATGLSRILLLPANPSRDRVIRDGHYYVEGRPLNETIFAHDPIHPRTTSRVAALLDGDLTGIAIPDTQSPDNVVRQAATLDLATLPVGAADFFAALLALRSGRKAASRSTVARSGPTLIVCGSIASWPQRRAEAEAQDVPAFTLPHDPSAIVRALQSSGNALLGIGAGLESQTLTPAALTDRLAQTVAALLSETPVARLMIEGGATSAAILHTLGWTRLNAIGVIGDVAVLQPAAARGPALFIKPGSYAWPATLWANR